jgi:REP element-mobilizing transposase RayT
LRAGSPHKTRPQLAARHPVHVVLRVVSAIGSLRRRSAYRAVREATLVAARRENFRIVHLSLQRTHIHLLVEAEDKHALAAGMQSFQISAAKQLNTEIGRARRGARRTGTVFPDRYHAEVITSPTQARHAIAYVLNNWRRHGEDRARYARSWKVDAYSSGILFPDWVERANEPFLWRWPSGYEPLVVYRPRTWLLRAGWQKAGTISYREVPAAARWRATRGTAPGAAADQATKTKWVRMT